MLRNQNQLQIRIDRCRILLRLDTNLTKTPEFNSRLEKAEFSALSARTSEVTIDSPKHLTYKDTSGSAPFRPSVRLLRARARLTNGPAPATLGSLSRAHRAKRRCLQWGPPEYRPSRNWSRGCGRGCNALLREMAVEPMVCDSLTQILRTEGSKCPLEEWALGGGKNRRVSCCDVRAGSSSRAAGGGGTRLGAGRRA